MHIYNFANFRRLGITVFEDPDLLEGKLQILVCVWYR